MSIRHHLLQSNYESIMNSVQIPNQHVHIILHIITDTDRQRYYKTQFNVWIKKPHN